MRTVSLSIIECVAPVTLKDVGARVQIRLGNAESLVCTVSKHFPFNLMIGFAINLDETTPDLRRSLMGAFGIPDLVTSHLTAVDAITSSIIRTPSLLESFGYESLEDLQVQLDDYKQQVRATEQVPTYLRGLHGHNIIASDDVLTAHVVTPASIGNLAIGQVWTLDTMV